MIIALYLPFIKSSNVSIQNLLQKVEKNSEACDHENDEKYDECVYNGHGKMIEENFSCVFEFFSRANKTNVKTPTRNCMIEDVNGKSAFQDIVYGIISK